MNSNSYQVGAFPCVWQVQYEFVSDVTSSLNFVAKPGTLMASAMQAWSAGLFAGRHLSRGIASKKEVDHLLHSIEKEAMHVEIYILGTQQHLSVLSCHSLLCIAGLCICQRCIFSMLESGGCVRRLISVQGKSGLHCTHESHGAISEQSRHCHHTCQRFKAHAGRHHPAWSGPGKDGPACRPATRRAG